MKLVCDEGVDRPIVEALRSDGHEVLYFAELDPSSSDEKVLERARELDAVLVTLDKDFGELVYRQGRSTSGIMLLRLAGLPPAEKCRVALTAVADHGAELYRAFTVVTPSKIRIRRPQ